MLSLMLDENISYVVADRLTEQRPDVPITSIHRWNAGALLGADDEAILRECAQHALTLVTYDVTTIPPLLRRLADQGASHAGVIFIDRKSIAPRDVGGLVGALIGYWDMERSADWTNRVAYLAPRPATPAP